MLNALLVVLGIIYVIACLWIILVVLLQEGKTGGMAGMEAPGQAPGALTDSLGVGDAQKTLFRGTAWGAAVFFTLALTLTILGQKKKETGGVLTLDEATPAVTATTPVEVPVTDGAAAPAGTPAAEATTPAETTTTTGTPATPASE